MISVPSLVGATGVVIRRAAVTPAPASATSTTAAAAIVHCFRVPARFGATMSSLEKSSGASTGAGSCRTVAGGAAAAVAIWADAGVAAVSGVGV